MKNNLEDKLEEVALEELIERGRKLKILDFVPWIGLNRYDKRTRNLPLSIFELWEDQEIKKNLEILETYNVNLIGYTVMAGCVSAAGYVIYSLASSFFK